jgi:serine/threonine-protein kinase RsbW
MTAVHDTFAMSSELASIDDARRWAGAHARDAEIAEEAIAEVEVAMTEALSNVIRYSHEGRPGEEVLLSLDIDDAKLKLGIRDRGKPFEPERYSPPNLDEPDEGGYGIFLIEELMDEVTRRPLQDGGTLMQLIRYRKEQP